MSNRPSVSFIGTLPPPLTGMTLATSIVVDHLAQRCAVRQFNISHPRFHRGLPWKLAKAWKSGVAMFPLVGWPAERGTVLYMVANAGGGIWYNIAHASVARRRGLHVYLHHQVYNYVHEYDRRMARLVRILGASSTHIVLCPEMRTAFERLYRPSGDYLVVPNSIVIVDQRPISSTRPHDPFRLGHLSNLTVEKGLDRVLETFSVARRRGLDVELVLAGPAASAEAACLIEAAHRRFGDALNYRGPVYYDAKWRFFADIDVLLFPTSYRREAYPLVLPEALLSGVPVITYARGCITTLLGSDGGLALDPGAEFTTAALELLERWLRDRTAYEAAAERAAARGKALQAEARGVLETLVDQMCEP